MSSQETLAQIYVMSRLLVFTGSPSLDSLKWNEEQLENELLPAFDTKQHSYKAFNPTQIFPVWRSLPLEATHLPTGMTQASKEVSFDDTSQQHAKRTIACSVAEGSPVESAPEDSSILDSRSSEPQSQILTQYYEHSFGVHDDLQSSQILGPGSAEALSSSTNAETEAFNSFESSDIDIHPQKQAVHARLHSSSISDLKQIPGAAYLRSIVPQTMTLNLVVGVISLSQARRIIPRKGGRPVELVEILVGDETHAGFNINIWIPPAEGQESIGSRNHEKSNLRNEVSQLRPRDVILARRVALNSFRAQVYGQSLRRGMTSLDLLFRRSIDAEDSRGVFGATELDANCEESEQIAKVRRVKDWLVQFVGGSISSNTKTPNLHPKQAPFSNLPLDTP